MSTPRTDVAIVGISAELPSGSYADHNLDHSQFFKFLLDKGEAYERIPEERFNIDKWYGTNPGQVKTDTGAFLKDISLFDHLEFGIASRDAKAMSVGTRKLIEHSFLALMDSEIEYRGRNVGCYMSAEMHGTADVSDNESRGSFAGYPYMVANKVSYHLDLRGPSLPLHTACSSTAVAFHLAVEAIRSGSCETALAGGSQLNYRYEDWVQYSDGGVLAPDGKCKPFDASADGFSRGEGIAVVVLKPLADAIRDGDHIYATVLGSNVNNPGNLAPVNAPVAEAQVSAMERAFKMARRSPSELDYLELHATGTSRGDPTETNGVGRFVASKVPMLVGSVKGNIGHLEITSFMASLSKVCSMFEHNVVPPTANLRTPNPKISFEELNFHVPLDPVPLPAKDPSGMRLMSIANYGISGVNVHVVLEGPPQQVHQELVDTRDEVHPVLFVAAGLTPKAATSVADSIAGVIKEHPTRLDELAATYGRRSRQMTWKSFGVFEPDRPLSFSKPALVPRDSPPLVFVLSGQGPQHINMGRDLFKAYPTFRHSVLEMDKVYEGLTGQSLIHTYGLFDDVDAKVVLPDVWPVAITHPSLTVFQIALVDLLRSFSVVPDAVVGHSAGETAVLYASGRYTKDMAVSIAFARGRAMSALENESIDGSMAAFGCDVETGSRIIELVKKDLPSGRVLELACINSRDAITLSGHSDALDKAVAHAQVEGIFARKIRTHVAIHSEIMELCREDYCSSLEKIFQLNTAQSSDIPIYSAVTGKRLREPLTSSYYWDGGRGRVLFADAIENILQDMPSAAFVEIGPHPVLSSYLDSLASGSSPVISVVRRGKVPGQEPVDLLRGIGSLVAAGCMSIDFRALNVVDRNVRDIELPAYPFQLKPIPYHRGSAEAPASHSEHDGPLVHSGASVSTITHPELAEHVIREEPIMPATGYLEMAFEAGGRLLWDVNFTGIMALPKQQPLNISIPVENCEWKVCSEYRDAKDADTRVHAVGYLSDDIQWEPSKIDIAAIQERCRPIEQTGIYPAMEYFAKWGPMYQRIESFSKGRNEALAVVRGADETMRKSGYTFHPALFDSCIHIIVHRSMTENADLNAYYLPSGVDQVVLFESTLPSLYEPLVYVYISVGEWTPDSISFDINVTNKAGTSICEMKGFRVAKHFISLVEMPSQRFDMIYQPFSFPALMATLSTPDPSAKDLSAVVQDNIQLLLSIKQTIKVYTLGLEKDVMEMVLSVLQGFDKVVELYVPQEEDMSSHTPYPYLRRITSISKSQSLADIPPSSADFVIYQSQAQSLPALVEPALVPGGIAISVARRSGSQTTSNDPPTHFKEDLFVCNHRRSIQLGNVVYDVSEAQKAPLALDTDIIRIFPGNFSLFSFIVEQEIELREALKRIGAFDSAHKSDIWIEATNDQNGAAARGFCRSFQKELASSRIRLVLFHEKWPLASRRSLVQRLKVTEGLNQETEIIVDARAQLFVPRISASIGPSETQDSASAAQSDKLLSASPAADDAVVEITATSVPHGGFKAIFGRVINGASSCWRNGEQVMGIVEEDNEGRFLSIHEGQLCARPDELTNVDVVLPMVHAALGVGLISIEDRCRFYDRLVLVEDDQSFASSVVQVLKALRIKARLINFTKSPEDLAELRSGSNIVLSGSTSEKHQQLIGRLASPRTHIYFWNSPTSGLKHALLKDRWVIKDVFKTVLSQLDPDDAADMVQKGSTNRHIPIEVPVERRTLLHPKKAYVLLGGIGSLGLEIAHWMYQNGARTLILTSRSGAASAARASSTSRRLRFLQRLPGIDLRLVACDASSVPAMKQLVGRIDMPIAACVLLAVVLSDVALAAHSEESYRRAVTPKIGSFKALQEVLDIRKLDFLVTLSSAATFGNAGQTNYSSANTTVDELTRGYDNAFSLIAPAIVDTDAITHSADYTPDPALEHWIPWAMTTQQVCDCLGDGVRKLKDGPFWLYVPDFNWNALQACFGPSPLYSHLITAENDTAVSVADASDKIAEIVCDLLSIPLEEVDVDVPLSSYGLDSLSASKLANLLRPIVVMTQVQLLGNVGIHDIRTRAIAATN